MRGLLFPVIIFSIFSINLSGQEGLSKGELKMDKTFKKVDISSGSRLVKLRKSKKSIWDFALFCPDRKSDELMPLVIGLHWAGGEGTYKEFSSCLAEPGLRDLGAFIISPEAEASDWYSEKNVEKVLGLVKLAVKNWPIDTNRIYIMGYSNGGIGSWYFAEKYPKIFSAAIPMASYYKFDGKIEIPMYLIHGSKDELFALSKTRFWVIQSRKSGSQIDFIEAKGLTHYEACNYVEYLKEAVDWLVRLNE